MLTPACSARAASNNAAWLRRKLAQPPDNQGRARSEVVRVRDQQAAIWSKGGQQQGEAAANGAAGAEAGGAPAPAPASLAAAAGPEPMITEPADQAQDQEPSGKSSDTRAASSGQAPAAQAAEHQVGAPMSRCSAIIVPHAALALPW